LESNDTDVIHGMYWLSKHKALIDCAKKSVKIITKDGKELEYVVEPIVTTKGATNHVLLNQLDASQESKEPVVNEFPDVFPEELLGIPPNRDIEFVIDLVLSTAPIYKRLYRMAAKQLFELKYQINEMLEKAYIHPSSSPWGTPMIFVPKKDGTQMICVIIVL
jgi:hypothetical protein